MSDASVPIGLPAGRAGSGLVAAGRMARRRLVNRLLWGIAGLMTASVGIPVAWVLAGVVRKGVAGWRWSVLTTTTTSANGGGLANAIVGTTLIVAGVVVIAGGVGVAGGVYLAEFSGARQGSIVRGASEVLAGVPSIVLGYVGYVALVYHFHWGFSLLAAWIVLSVLCVPYIVKTTEVALRNVPTAYRDGSEALGMPTSYALRRVVLRPALPGIATVLIVAVAISLGETAPLLYTASWSDRFPTTQLTHANVPFLTYPVWTFYNLPSSSAHRLAAEAALILIVMVVVLIVLSRIVVARTQRHTENSSGR